jgi:hypothetical protein
MSQKPNVFIEEKSQINFIEEISKILIHISYLGFVSTAFLTALGKPNFYLFAIFSTTIFVGIVLKMYQKQRNEDVNYDD